VIVVVADTSPLNYLIQVNCDHVLPTLYEQVLVPGAVVQELDHPKSGPSVRAWLTHLPSWLVVEQVAEPFYAFGQTGSWRASGYPSC
jgi:uncharacterized protein